MSTDLDNGSGSFLGCLFMLVILAYSVVQFYAGWIGIEHHLGSGWANAALVAVLVFWFSLPLTIGSFFGAMNVWGWPWAGALAFAAPGLALMALMYSGTLAGLMSNIRRRSK